ncbi:MAG: flagellar hook-basal body complex protein [Cyanobacteria bacterium REEB65]|nr:flagellar hook-basal body complex protein [Cyanobacteria bacterium REEB65]
MLQSLDTAITGLHGQQLDIDVISNNIANVNTTAYKSQSVTFASMLSQTLHDSTAPTANLGGTNAMQVGVGVSSGSISSDETQGSLESTGKTTDMALSGDGYFMVNDGAQSYYTRDGSFDFDANGNLVQTTTGMKVQGWSATNGTIPTTGAPGNVVVPKSLTLKPQASGTFSLQGNLNAASTDVNLAGVLQGTNPVNVALRTLNSKNEVIAGTVTYTPVAGTSSWNVSFAPDAGSAGKLTSAASQTLGTITFDSSGKPSSGTTLQPISLNYTTADGATAQSLSVDASNMTFSSTAASSAIGFQTVDGGGAAIPAGYSGLVYAGDYSMSVNYYDSLGVLHSGSLVMQRDVDQQSTAMGSNNPLEWRVLFASNDPTIKNNVAPSDLGNLKFDQGGVLNSASLSSLSLNYNNGAAASSIQLNPGTTGTTTGLTQNNNASTALANNDGYAAGSLTGIHVDSSGILSGVFSNGQLQQLAQVSVASFANPGGLETNGQDLFSTSNNSGIPEIGTAGTQGRGVISAGSLEQSNVDLSQQFADLIVAQRGFQANARVVTTSDQILQELLQLKQ